MPGWRKWQTRRSQKPLGVIPCGFESRSRYKAFRKWKTGQGVLPEAGFLFIGESLGLRSLCASGASRVTSATGPGARRDSDAIAKRYG